MNREAFWRLAERTGQRERLRSSLFRRRYGFDPPPDWSDLTGYEALLDVVLAERLNELPGDVLEIGVLMGGGTAKLCGLLGRLAPDKRVIAVDLFDPSFDPTESPLGMSMAEIYDVKVGDHGSDQRAVFDKVTSGARNLVVVAGDSTKVGIPTDQLALAFIDGHHATDYVRADFDTAWSRTVPGGVVAFHDYGGDLRHLTAAIHQLIGEHADEIDRVWTNGIIMFVKRVKPTA
jgi:hypothetical protein